MSIANEVMLLKAKLAAKKQEFEQLKLKADNYIILLRNLLDPYEDDFTELELERAEIAMDDFYKLFKEAVALKNQIAKMEKDLNG